VVRFKRCLLAARPYQMVKLEMGSSKVDESLRSKFAQAIGILLYLSACTRPDISVAVCKLARFTNTRIQWRM
jgi:hypothetical protein